MRFESSSPEGPCVAVSSADALALSTAFVSVVVVCAGGGGVSTGLVPQLARNTSDPRSNATETIFFICTPSWQEWAPDGFADLARVGIEPRGDLSVYGNGLQHALRSLAPGED